MVSVALRCKLSIWTTPVSHSTWPNSTGKVSVRSNSHRSAAVRTMTGLPWFAAADGVDDLDDARGVAEAVPRHVKHKGVGFHYRDLQSRLTYL